MEVRRVNSTTTTTTATAAEGAATTAAATETRRRSRGGEWIICREASCFSLLWDVADIAGLHSKLQPLRAGEDCNLASQAGISARAATQVQCNNATYVLVFLLVQWCVFLIVINICFHASNLHWLPYGIFVYDVLLFEFLLLYWIVMDFQKFSFRTCRYCWSSRLVLKEIRITFKVGWTLCCVQFVSLKIGATWHAWKLTIKACFVYFKYLILYIIYIYIYLNCFVLMVSLIAGSNSCGMPSEAQRKRELTK